MAPAMTRFSLANRWLAQFRECVEQDEWGQREEAQTIYQKIGKSMAEELSNDCSSWSEKEADTVEKLAICMRLRANEINKGDRTGITLENMKTLTTVMESLFKQSHKFPLDLSSVDKDDLQKAKNDIMRVGRKKAEVMVMTNDDSVEELSPDQDNSVVSKSAARSQPGETIILKGRTLKFILDKIGFKDESMTLVDPMISAYVVSTYRMSGVQIDSKVSQEKDGKYFVFGGDTLVMQQSFESILPGSAVIFEFKHFKKEKSKISTKCWAFLEREEIKPGVHVLELYKKPVDLKRKKLSLFTVKPLYLHLQVAFEDRQGTKF